MKKTYAVVIAIAAILSLLYLLYQHVAAAEHQRALQVCTEKFEQIRADAAQIESVNLYPFQKHREDFIWVSNFSGGLAAFSGIQQDRKKKGIVDFNGNIVLEYRSVARVDSFVGFDGFKDGRTKIFVYKYETVPWGFLLPYGNPVPRVYGTLDCTGKVVLRKSEHMPLGSRGSFTFLSPSLNN